MSDEAQARAAARTQVMLKELHLMELLHARDLTQRDLADRRHTTQPTISELEHRSDMYLSTLRRYVEAMGGTLVMVAQFPDNVAVRLQTFRELGHDDVPVPAGELAPA